MKTKPTPSVKPLIVDKKTKRFWTLVDPKDGTMYSQSISAEYSVDPRGDYEVDVYTDRRTAERAAAAEKLNNNVDLVAVEVEIFAKASA